MAEVAELLIERGADVNQVALQNDKGIMPTLLMKRSKH